MNTDLIKQFVPFSELDDKYLEDVLKQVKIKRFGNGDMVFKRGREVAERFYLLSGRVDLIDGSYSSSSMDGGTTNASTALNPENPTRASCIAKSKVKTFAIEIEALDRIVSWSESAAYATDTTSDISDDFSSTREIEVSTLEEDDDGGDWMSSMLQSPLFARIPMTKVQELFTRFEDEVVEKGTVVVKEGRKGDYFYVLASGTARVSNHAENVNVVLKPGSYFGEEALLGQTPRNATITMLENGQLKRLEADAFEALLKAPILQYVEEDDLPQIGKPHKIIDVKMPMEYRIHHTPGSINVPLARLRSTMSELARSKAYVVPDDAGSRADIAAHLLCQAGFDAYILKSKEE